MTQTYDGSPVDQYMRRVLEIDLTQDETDNVLTALTALTTIHSRLFPFEATFVRPDKEIVGWTKGVTGIRFETYDQEGMVRVLRVPRKEFASLDTAIHAVAHPLMEIA